MSETLRLEVRRKAAEDIAEAAVWYEQRSQGLGTEFIRAIDACLALIVRNPLAFPVVHREARMALPRRFPYKVIYRAKSEAIIVVAVMQQPPPSQALAKADRLRGATYRIGEANCVG